MIKTILNYLKDSYNYLNTTPINQLFKPKQEEINEFNLKIGQSIKFKFYKNVDSFILKLDENTYLSELTNCVSYNNVRHSKLFDNVCEAYYYLEAMTRYSLEFD
jgi:hypothetical protein